MALPYEVSLLRDWFRECDALWPVRIDESHYWLSNDFVGEVQGLPDSIRGYPIALSDSRPRSGVPITRLTKLDYANRGGSKILVADRVPSYGQGVLPIPQMQGMVRRGIVSEVGGRIAPEGYMWTIAPHFGDLFADAYTDFLTVGDSYQQDTIGIHRISGMLGYWRTQIPSRGIDVQWVNRGYGYGRALVFADFWGEATSEGNFLHNPTSAGTSENSLLEPLVRRSLMSAPMTKYRARITNGVIDAGAENVPTEFGRAFPSVNPLEIHGGSPYQPVIWPNMRHAHDLVAPFNGMVGVARRRLFSSIGFDLSTIITSGSIDLVAILTIFDELWAYDPASQTQTQLTWSGGVPPAQYTSYSFKSQSQSMTVGSDGVHAGTGVTTPIASPFTSKNIAAIYKQAGTSFSPPTGFSVGIYLSIEPEITNLFGGNQRDTGLDTLTINCCNPDVRTFPPFSNWDDPSDIDGYCDPVAFIPARVGSTRARGMWSGQFYIVTGHYDDVVARIRSLYLAGFRSSVCDSGP